MYQYLSSQFKNHAAPVTKIAAWHLIAGLLTTGISFILFCGIFDVVEDKSTHLAYYDRSILLWFHSHQRPGFTELAEVLAWMGSPLIMGIFTITGVVIGFVNRKVRGAAWTFPFAIIGAGIIIQILKTVVERSRPDLFVPLLKESGYSFPSGHSMIAVVVYGLFGYFGVHLVRHTYQRVIVVAVTIVVIVLIGVSRPYVGVHYPSDVLAGWFVGVPWLTISLGMHEVIARRWGSSGEPVLRKTSWISRTANGTANHTLHPDSHS